MGRRTDDQRDEVAVRVAHVRGLLERRLYIADVLRVAGEKFGVNRATARRYVKAARDELVLSTGLPRRAHRAVSLNYYGTVVRASLVPRGHDHAADPVTGVPAGFTATVREGLEAQGRIVDLLGLAVDRDPELDALKAELRGLIATLRPHAAAHQAHQAAALAGDEHDAPAAG